jgi:hypothetical protein
MVARIRALCAFQEVERFKVGLLERQPIPMTRFTFPN